MDHERWTSTLANVVQPGVVAGVAFLLLLDATIGRRLLHAHDFAVVAGAAVLVAVAFRRRSPALAACVAAGVSIGTSLAVSQAGLTVWSRFIDAGAWPGLAEAAGLALLAGFVARSSPWPSVVFALASITTAMALMAWVRLDSPYEGVLGALLLGGLTCTAGAGFYLRSLEAARHRDAARARQDERLAIARELHDVVAHHVTGIVVQAQAARLVAGTRPDAVTDALADIEQAGSQAMAAMRHLVGTLRAERDDAPLAPTAAMHDVRELVEQTTAAGLPVELEVDADESAVPGELAASVHRIVREALTNVRRHAIDASRVIVRIAQVDDQLRITVTDDGRPSGRRGSGFGLPGMTERAEAIGGRLMAGPMAEGGWVVAAVLPLSTNAPA